ncbi:MAG: alpha-amylase family glycosyl hydrolase [Chitinophagales bacterium]|nr:alpha-amylase family glycosyl hydrolase [Chitinophagales bacterium]MDW8392641.1 alpha-amylase family glycosyl hydrolase [Chitinophagales bacterium]
MVAAGPDYADLQQRTFYQIFIRSFRDSNGDGIGDLNGIRLSLPYLAHLGIGGIWITPFFPAPSYHKYDPVDLCAIDPQYGTLTDFCRLVEEAHRHDILVLMDWVANHTSWRHPWFVNALHHKGPYRNFYLWDATPQKPVEGQWHLPSGADTDKEKYYACFSRTMPDLNFDHPQVRRLITEAACWWLRQTGIDGFRLDAAQHIYPSDQTQANVRWWKAFAAAVRKVNPQAILIGECWNRVSNHAPYLQALDGVFNFELAEAVQQALLEERHSRLAHRIAEMEHQYSEWRQPFLQGVFLSNHDMPRIFSVLRHNIDKMRLAACILLTLPGVPFLYYGEEIGMRGRKPDPHLREPFIWSREPDDEGQTHWQRPRYSTRRTVVPAWEQYRRPSSLLQGYRRLIALRRNNPALGCGKFIPMEVHHESLLAYERCYRQQRFLVLHNLSGQRRRLAVKWLEKKFDLFFCSHAGTSLNRSYLSLPPYGSVVLKPAER